MISSFTIFSFLSDKKYTLIILPVFIILYTFAEIIDSIFLKIFIIKTIDFKYIGKGNSLIFSIGKFGYLLSPYIALKIVAFIGYQKFWLSIIITYFLLNYFLTLIKLKGGNDYSK